MAIAYCEFNGNRYKAKRIKEKIRIDVETEIDGFEKIIDEYDQIIWRKYVSVEECDDYYEISMAMVIDNTNVELSVTAKGKWVVETGDELLARRNSLDYIDRNKWGKVLTADDMLDAKFCIIYSHTNESMNKELRFDLWSFLEQTDVFYEDYPVKHLVYRGVFSDLLCHEYEISEERANNIFDKIAMYDDIFIELIYLCKNGELLVDNCTVVEGYTAKELNDNTYLTKIGAINYLVYLKRDPEKAIRDLKAGLPRR